MSLCLSSPYSQNSMIGSYSHSLKKKGNEQVVNRFKEGKIKGIKFKWTENCIAWHQIQFSDVQGQVTELLCISVSHFLQLFCKNVSHPSSDLQFLVILSWSLKNVSESRRAEGNMTVQCNVVSFISLLSSDWLVRSELFLICSFFPLD